MDADRLRAIPLFASLDAKARKALAAWADEVDLPAGRALATQGAFAYEFVVIEEGTAEVTQDGRHLRALGPGDFVGEIGLLETERRTASVVTTSPMRAVVMTGVNFKATLREHPEVDAQIRQAIAERLGGTG